MKPDSIQTNTREETVRFAKDFAKTLKGGSILCLYGNLGSGKTTFTQGLARGLGIERRIISPTFIIVRTYALKSQITNLNDQVLNPKSQELMFYHIDLYRTDSKNDLLGLGIDEIINDKNNIVVIEWAEKMKDLLPKKRIDINFKYLQNENSRMIEIKNYE